MKRIAQLRERLTKVAQIIGGELELLCGRIPTKPRVPHQAVVQWLDALRPAPEIRGRILITALRNRTWIGWAAYAACVLRQQGWETTLLVEGSELRSQIGVRFINQVKRIPGLELLDLEVLSEGSATESWAVSTADQHGASSLAYDLHLEEEDIHRDPAFSTVLARRKEMIVSHARRLYAILSSMRFHRFLCFSGLIGTTPGLLAAANARYLTTVCLEGWAWRAGHMVYNLNAPALEYNVRGWLAALGDWDDIKEREVNAYLRFTDGQVTAGEAWLDNFYRIQRAHVSSQFTDRIRGFVNATGPLFILTPNVVGDSSMLRRNTIFPGQQTWTKAVIDYVKARPHIRLIVRAHPAEIWVGAKCTVRMGEIAQRYAGAATNILVLHADDPVNTFSLLPFARAGLVWLSSAGPEMVARGLPVVCAANAKYAGLGFAEEPSTEVEYFSVLDRLTALEERPAPARMLAAKRYLHMVFKGFSFPGAGVDFMPTSCRLNEMPEREFHERFFRILTGDEPMPDVAALVAQA